MTRIAVVFLRFVGRVILAVSDEIDRATTDYKVEDNIPDTVPEYFHEDRDLS